MATREEGLALETMAAFLSPSSPERRELEAEAYFVWKEVEPGRAKVLAKTWEPDYTPHLDRVLFKLYRRDPKQARALMPDDWQKAQELCELWVTLLLEDWQEGDGAIAAIPINYFTNRKMGLPIVKEVAARLHEFSSTDQQALIVPLLRHNCLYVNLTDAKMLAQVLACSTEQEQDPQFLIRVCHIVTTMSEMDVSAWLRELRRETRGLNGPAVRIARILGLARVFDTRYRYNKPKTVSGRFVARWRRLVEAIDWIEQIPSDKARELVKQRHANLMKGTARRLREEAEKAIASSVL